MKKKDKSNYHGMTEKELESALSDMQKQITTYQTEKYTKQMKNTREMRNLKKKQAVILTILHAKELQREK